MSQYGYERLWHGALAVKVWFLINDRKQFPKGRKEMVLKGVHEALKR